MSDRPLLSATMIVRNEKQSIARALTAVADHVDEIVIVDTGSTDGTLHEARRVLRKRGHLEKLKTARFTWVDDFAAARQAADELATGDWLVWLDADDEIVGMEQLREYAAKASSEVAAFFCRYRYAADGDGNTISELWRERLVRNDGTRWEGRLHEHKLITSGAIVRVDPQIAEWIHHRDHAQRTGERNLRILEKWLVDEPGNARVMQSIAMEYMGADRHKDASDMFARYLECPGEAADRRAQACRHMCVMLMIQGRVEDAAAAAMRSLSEFWTWADTHLTLAEAAQTMGKPDQAILHAQDALAIGQPDTLLIINPLQYSAHPRTLIGVCLGQLGRLEESLRMLEEAVSIAPSYPLAAQQLPVVRGALKKEHAVGTVIALSDVLVESGELLKAQALLGAAPWYVVDDERLIGRRGQLHRLIGERSSAPALVEDPDADAFVARHCTEDVEAVAA